MSIAIIDRITHLPRKKCSVQYCSNTTQGIDDYCAACQTELNFDEWAENMANLMNKEHVATNEKSRDGYDKTFGLRCHIHTTRKAVAVKNGVALCAQCAKDAE